MLLVVVIGAPYSRRSAAAITVPEGGARVCATTEAKEAGVLFSPFLLLLSLLLRCEASEGGLAVEVS